MMTRNRARLALGAGAIVLVAAGFWAGKSLTTATLTPTVRTGTVGLVGSQGDEFRINGQRPDSFGLPSDVTWRNAYGIWQEGTRPACMAPLSSGQRISFGVINAAPVADAPGGPVVVWIECPSRPIPRYPIVTPSTASG